MADNWLPDFERVPSPWWGGTYTGGAWKFVAHTTEGLSRDPRSVASAHEYPPHLWVTLPSHPYAPRRKMQLVPLNKSAAALVQPSGVPATNKARAIQVEIEGYAEQSHLWTPHDLDWLADEVIGPACHAMGIDASHYRLSHGKSAGWTLASTSARQRMSWAEWAVFDGICGHQHVPGNDHWDPGALDLGRISRRIAAPAPPSEEDWLTMATLDDLRQIVRQEIRPQLWHNATDGRIWMVEPGGVWRRWVTGPAELDALIVHQQCVLVFDVPPVVIATRQDTGEVTEGLSMTVDQLRALPGAISYDVGRQLAGLQD